MWARNAIPRYRDLGSSHHEEFVRKFTSDISTSLEVYGKSKGCDLTKQFYDDMAWGGLQNTVAFEKLDIVTKERIINVIALEAFGKNSEGEITNQKGKKIICDETKN